MATFLPTRRDFVHLSGTLVGGVWLTLSLSACRDAARSAAEATAKGEGPTTLSDAEMKTFAAVADRIFPPDGDAPGAAALGAGMFADHVVAKHADWRTGVQEAIAKLPVAVAKVRPGVQDFTALSAADQDAVVAALEKDDAEHFGLLCTLTLGGVLADPSRGGNMDKKGWALIGFDDRHVWQPPFGYYDAQAAKGGEG